MSYSFSGSRFEHPSVVGSCGALWNTGKGYPPSLLKAKETVCFIANRANNLFSCLVSLVAVLVVPRFQFLGMLWFWHNMVVSPWCQGQNSKQICLQCTINCHKNVTTRNKFLEHTTILRSLKQSISSRDKMFLKFTGATFFELLLFEKLHLFCCQRMLLWNLNWNTFDQIQKISHFFIPIHIAGKDNTLWTF